MKVTRIRTELIDPGPSPQPIRDALQSLPGAGSLKVSLETNEGLTGHGSTSFGRMVGAPHAIQAIVEHILTPLVLGCDPEHVRAVHETLLRETEYGGSGGLAMIAVSAIDTALWDLLGKAADMPVWRLLGAAHESIPAYAMVGWLNYGDDEIQEICTRALDHGFRALKLKVGFPTIEQDVRRIELVRRAVGPNTVLMVDANQSLTTAEAIRRGRVFEDLGCFWFEEPLPAADIRGYAELAAALAIPIATGENLYGRHAFAPFISSGAVDVVQGDLRRAGGPTEVLAIAAAADAFRLPYASHGGGAVNLNLLATMPNAIYLETGLSSPGSPLTLENGRALLPKGPGFSW